MIISIIVAHGINLEIGLDNKLLWHIPNDFKNFKKITSGHHILMGRKTYESIGKPLPNRTNIVLSRGEIKDDKVLTLDSIDKAINKAKDNGETELFIIGGSTIYKELIHLADRLYISEVDYSGDADAYFDYIDINNWELVKEEYNEELDGIPNWIYKEYKSKYII